MTSPDNYTPDKAYGPSSVSNMQNVTQTSNAAAGNLDIKNILDLLGLSFVNNLLGGFDTVVQAISGGINQFQGTLNEIFTGVENGNLNDVGSWINRLLGRTTSLAARVSAIEGKIATGAEFYDDFNRGVNNTTLGNGWTQGGNGQPFGILDQAAQITPGGPINVNPGLQWAKSPKDASSDDFIISMVTHPGAVSEYAQSQLIARANSAFTAGISVRLLRGSTTISKWTRSGVTWNWTDLVSTAKSYSPSATVEFVGSGPNLSVRIDSTIVLEISNSDHSIGAGFRSNGMSGQTTVLQFGTFPSYSGGFASYSLKSGTALASVSETASTVATAVAEQTVAPVAAAAVEAKSTAVTTSNTVRYVQEVVNVRSGRAIWESGPDPTGDPTFPFNDITEMVYPTNTGGFSCADAAHSHGGLGVGWSRISDSVTATASNYPMGIVRFGGAVQKKTVTYMAMKSGTVDGLYFDLYKMDALGNFNFIQSSNNEIGLIGASYFVNQAMFPTNFLVDIGDVFMVQIRVVGTGSVMFPAKSMMNYGFLGSFVPRSMSGARNPSGTPVPAQITMSQMNSMYNYLIPWFSIGMDLATKPVPRYFNDNFDRAELNASVRYLLFGPNNNTFTPYLEQNQLRPRSGTAGWQGIIYPQPLISDDWFIEWRVRADTNDRGRGAYMGDTSGTGVFFFNTRYGITVSSVTGFGNSTTTDRYFFANNYANGLCRMEYNSATKALDFYFNNVFQKSFDDTAGNYVPKGSGKRFFGLEVSNSNFADSDWVDDLTFGDIVRTVGS